MDRLLVALVPYGNAGWQWLILEDNKTIAYRAQAGDDKLYIRSPISLYVSSHWTETDLYNYMTALTFENAKKEIRRVFNPIDTCMFNVRNKETLERLIAVYGQLMGRPEMRGYWGYAFDSYSQRREWYCKVFGEQGTLTLGHNIIESCDNLRSLIREAIDKRQQSESEDLPFSVLSDP